MTAPFDYTADQITEAIGQAIRNQDFEAVVSLLKLLAVKDPHRAEAVLASINLGMSINTIISGS